MTPPEDADAATPPAWFTKALAVAPEHESIDVDGAAIAYRSWGESGRRGLVLVHGGAAHSGWWDHIGPLLAIGRRVVAVDLSGHGDSGRRDTYSFDQWASEVMAVAADAGIAADPIVIGHSMGGFVTLRTAALFGPRLGGAVLLDSAVRDLTPEEQAAREQRAFGPLRLYPTKDVALAHFHPIPDQPTLPYIAAHVAASSVREVTGGWSWKFDPRIFTRTSLTQASLSRVDCRLALFRAEHGRVSRQIGQAMYDRLGRITPVVEIPAAGHHVMLDQPIALVAALRTLLADWEYSVPSHASSTPD